MTKPTAIEDSGPNYREEYAEFLKMQRENPKLTLKEFMEVRGLVSYTNTSRNFAHLSRVLAGDKLAMLAPRAADKIGELLDNEDSQVSQKAADSILNRTGFSPQALSLKINNNIVVMPPIFAKEEQADMDSMFEVIDEAQPND